MKTKIASCHTADSIPIKQEVNGTVILPPLVFPALKGGLLALWNNATIIRLGWNLLKVTAQHTSLLVQKIITRVKSFMI
jgi:hypothetical protein